MSDKTTDGTLPMVECPECEREFQWDDYYDVERGSEYECPHCKAQVVVILAERQTYVQLGVKPNV